MVKIYDIFHVSLLCKADIDPSLVLLQVHIKIEEDLTLKVILVRVLDCDEKDLRNDKIAIIKVLWRSF